MWTAVAVGCGLAVAVVTGRWVGVAGGAATGAGARAGAGAGVGAGAGAGAGLRVPVVPPTGLAAIEATVSRLAEGRAEAFRRASIEPLVAVDEPGSPALTADLALVRRLRVSGVQLAGLTFRVVGVRLTATGADGSLVVAARVVTSAHVQQPLSGAAEVTAGVTSSPATGQVPQSPPRDVILTLVPGRDGRGWLVRSVR
jgi:hypothetical protein